MWNIISQQNIWTFTLEYRYQFIYNFIFKKIYIKILKWEIGITIDNLIPVIEILIPNPPNLRREVGKKIYKRGWEGDGRHSMILFSYISNCMREI